MAGSWRRSTAGLVAMIGPLLWAGCEGVPTASETAARTTLAEASEQYRPGGGTPALPTLGYDSPPEAFMRYAVFRNPAVTERFHLWAGAVEQITIARSRPDPTLSLELEVSTMLELLMPSLFGEFPNGAKLFHAAEAQSHQAAARRAEFEREIVRTAARARTLYFEAWYLEASILITREIVTLVGELETLASSRFAVSQATLQDVLRVQIEKAQVENEVLSLEDSRNTIRARLRQVLGIPAGEADPPIPVKPPPAESSMPEGDLVATAFERDPELKAVEAEIREAEALISLARSQAQPDFMVDVGVSLLSPIAVVPEVGITLPIWKDKIRAGIAAATALRRAAGARLDAARLETVMRLAEWQFLYRDAGRRLRLLRDVLLPNATQALDVARRSYPTGEVDLTSLLDAERSLFNFRLNEARARMEAEVALSQIMIEILARLPFAAPIAETRPAAPRSE